MFFVSDSESWKGQGGSGHLFVISLNFLEETEENYELYRDGK
jgi:hypothetical protein